MKQTRIISIMLLFACALTVCLGATTKTQAAEFIKWVDCKVSCEVLTKTVKMQLKYRESGNTDFNFCDAVAYLATKNGNRFSSKTDSENLKKLQSAVDAGKTMDELYSDNKYYNYYRSAYSAIFSQYIGAYRLKNSAEEQFGIKVCFPFAKGRWYNHYDDFGNSRSFGFTRKHLGHDIMGSIGTPIMAIEGGIVTELGWNRYGGWRIGITSFDTKRYYYYAHLRKDKPYAGDLKIGDEVHSGAVIGYLGNTGYSDKENQNLKTGNPHLHVGLQLIFDESQKDGNGEIWVDLYEITKFLSSYRIKAEKQLESGEYLSLEEKIYL